MLMRVRARKNWRSSLSSWDMFKLLNTSLTMVSFLKAPLSGSRISSAFWSGERETKTASWWHKQRKHKLLFSLTWQKHFCVQTFLVLKIALLLSRTICREMSTYHREVEDFEFRVFPVLNKSTQVHLKPLGITLNSPPTTWGPVDKR